MFRALDHSTELGREVAAIMARGELVPDEITIRMIRERLAQPDAVHGFILDGFPRNLAQAHIADEALSRRGIGLEAIVYLEVPEEELRRRLLARAEIEDRSDDTPEVIAHRLEVFAHDTFPLVDHYRDRGLLITVRGDRPPDDVTADVLSQLATVAQRAAQ
jgi:adenylate kinase